MDPNAFKFQYKISSGFFQQNQVISEIEALKSTGAFKSVVGDIDGFIPRSMRTGSATTLKNFVITDDASLLEGQNVAPTPGQSIVSKNGDYIIYINPNVVQFDPTSNRTLSIAEIVTHELGHSTQRGLAATDRYYVTQSDSDYKNKEDIAYAYESNLVKEKGLSSIPNSHGSNTVRQRLSGENPSYLYNQIPECFLAGTPVLMADGQEKNIELIASGDVILAFDPNLGPSAPLVPKRVRQTFRNHTRTIIDLRGVRCTPGHVFYSGDGERGASFKTIAVILKDDGTIVDGSGTRVRARTGCPLGSLGDRVIQVAFHDPADGIERRVAVRAGIPVTVDRNQDGHAVRTLAAWLAGLGVKLHPDGQVSDRDGTLYDAVDWPAGSSPLDTIETQNWVVRGPDGRDYTPPWIAALSEQDERPALRIAG